MRQPWEQPPARVCKWSAGEYPLNPVLNEDEMYGIDEKDLPLSSKALCFNPRKAIEDVLCAG